MKKKFTIVKTDLFKQQEKSLPASVKKDLKKALAAISKDPMNVPHSMSIGGKGSPEELKNWAYDLEEGEIDLVLEYLNDKNCLNKAGKKLAKDFWTKYIKSDKK